MSYEEIDRAMRDAEIVPSSGFTDAVMEAVRRDAAAPAPIPFPWKRAIPGFVAAWAVVIAVFVPMLAHAAPGGIFTLSPLALRACLGAVVVGVALGCLKMALRWT